MVGEGVGDLDIDGGVWICVLDGTDRDIKTNGCVRVLSLNDQFAESTGFEFCVDGRTGYLSIQHLRDRQMPLDDDYRTDDSIKVTGLEGKKRTVSLPGRGE